MDADIAATRLHYEQTGDGPPIIFVHGLGGTGNVWAAQRQALAKFFTVVTLDLPGAGRSPRQETACSMAGWADLVAAFAALVKLEPFVLVAHSMSTILAQHCAARHAQKVRALVLCGPLTELSPAGREAFVKRAATVLAEGMTPVADQVVAGALTPATREGNPLLAGLFREMLLANDPRTYAAHCQALIEGSALAAQPNIACPTLILVGDQDGVTPLANCLAIARAVKGAAIRVIPATAHLTMAERPEAFNAALLDFLAAIR